MLKFMKLLYISFYKIYNIHIITTNIKIIFVMKPLVDKYIGGYNGYNERRHTIKIYGGDNRHIMAVGQSEQQIFSSKKRSVGEESEFKIRDILISLKYLDISSINKKNIKGKQAMNKIHKIFLLNCKNDSLNEIFNEIDFLVSLPDKKFAQIYAKKFKLHWPFSDAIKPLFMIIKKYFENLIIMISPDFLKG